MGEMYYNRNDLDAAERWYKKAIKNRPNHVDAHFGLGLVYMSKTKWDAAEREFKKILDINPEDTAAHYRLGDIYMECAKSASENYGLEELLDAAERWYKKVIKINPKDWADQSYGHCKLGDVYKKQGKIDAAVREYKKSLKFFPEYEYVHHRLGDIYREQGKIKAAAQEYKKAKINPDIALSEKLSVEKSQDAGKSSHPIPNKRKLSINKAASNDHPSEESQKKENLPEGSSWMEDPEFAKELLKRRGHSKDGIKQSKDIWGE